MSVALLSTPVSLPAVARPRVARERGLIRCSAKKEGEFWFDPSNAPQKAKIGTDFGPLEAAHHFFIKGYQPEFHVANATLLAVEAALFNLASNVDPITSGNCAVHPTALGCFFTSETKAFPDEIGFAMFFAGLAYTGFIAALAVKNCKICKAYLLKNGFREQELEGVTTYMVLRYAELLVRDNKTSEAKAYMKRIREESGYFITSYEKGEKTYVPPWETDRVPATARSNVVAFKRKPAKTTKKKTTSSEREKVGQ
ncbi:predicted protein [Micromonas commoda]|uniref:Uncharacterized protein n=1 Tax=Micromonas commoda (strain RCC299 / NOUM17 / CCMP2709) TaxID=296587 RepID=C1E8W9_MICCC|nr:predicted protein [Micromonas commoda]ACO64228.1 predicted protein [Micromonas commoda]|eukprot:XP_002502970.1 predicted protein [Micromonas commoda]